jgi:hypothetical protein
MSPLLNQDLAYIAGFFDGEGSIVISPTGKKARDLSLTVVIVQTDRVILEWIRAILDCGGGVHSRSRAGSLGKRECFALQWGGASAADVLFKLLPYLRVKKGRAEIALDFQATMKRRGVNTPENILDARERLRSELKSS